METPAEHAAQQIAWHLETQTSVELEVTTTIIPLGENAKRTPDFTTTVEHYIETATSQRFLDFRGMKAGATVIRSKHYGDRGVFTDVNYQLKDTERQVSAYITNHFFMEDSSDRRQLPQPLLFLYVGHKPLHKALLKAQYLGTSEYLSRECELFLFKDVRWSIPQDQLFFLDKRTSVPLKVEAFRDESSREKKQPMSVWMAKSLDSVQGYLIPLKSTMTAYGKDGGAVFTWDFDVNKIKFNETYPDSTFRSVLQPGITVLDSVVNKSYQVPGDVVAPPSDSPNDFRPNGQTVQATPPTDWSSTLSSGSLALGVALIVIGMIVWWRRR